MGNVLPPQKLLAMGRALCLHPGALSVSLGTHTKEVESSPVSSSLLSDESAAAPRNLCCDGATKELWAVATTEETCRPQRGNLWHQGILSPALGPSS